MPKNMLVLGGTQFIGRAFCDRLLANTHFDLTILNRGVTNPDLFDGVSRLQCDREDLDACARVLDDTSWDYIVDFSGHTHYHIENIVTNCRFGHYTFVSSSAVELSWPEDQLFQMAQNKLWCEHLLQNAARQLLIVRPGYVVGQHDHTNRFESRGGVWVWKETTDPVQPVIDAGLLTSLMLELIARNHTGMIRAGYTQPRVLQDSNHNAP